MEQIVGHKSMLLVVAAAAYILARLSQFGHSKSDAISFQVTSALLVLFLIAYFLCDLVPYIEIVGLGVAALVIVWVSLILPGPAYKISVPSDKKVALSIELCLVGVLSLVAAGLWQGL